MVYEKNKKYYFFWMFHIGIAKSTLSQIYKKLSFDDMVNIYNGHFLDYAISKIRFLKKDVNILSDNVLLANSKHEVSKIFTDFTKFGVKVVFFYDDLYPVSLKEIPNPPFVIFARGNYAQLDKIKLISVAGSRQISTRSAIKLRHIITELVQKNYGIVSGLALGTDIIANETAYKDRGYSVAVLPSSIFSILPKTNVASAEKLLKNGGLLISEYYDNNFSKSRYIQRNRIISGLGSAVLLPEFKARSGTIHTARFAWLQNKVYTGSFDGSYGTAVVNAVSSFATTMALSSTNGASAGIDVFMSLLTSAGNPDRSAIACDTSFQLNATRVSTLKKAGYSIVGRYLTGSVGSGSTERAKNLTATEVQTITSAGLALFPIFQNVFGYFDIRFDFS